MNEPHTPKGRALLGLPPQQVCESPDYTELIAERDRWHKEFDGIAAEAAKLIAERDALNHKLEDRNCQLEHWQHEAALSAERADRAEAACAEKDSVLRRVLEWSEMDSPDFEIDAETIRTALSTDAGRSFVPIEDVKGMLFDFHKVCGCAQCEAGRTFAAKHGEELRRSDETPLPGPNPS